jgi:hypothetical protein
MNEIEIIVPSDPEYHGVCITDPTRVSLWHTWLRTRDHVWRDNHWPFFPRYHAMKEIDKLLVILLNFKKPPQRWHPKFFWGGIPGKL